MRKFDTKVQHLKYKVLREVARLAWEDKLLENVLDIPQIIVPTTSPTMRCCVYKERAVLSERVKLAMGVNADGTDNPNKTIPQWNVTTATGHKGHAMRITVK